MKKYEFTGETKKIGGTTLHRIRALKEIDLGWKTVKPGELGGWLEKEANLSQDGNAWVFGDANVYGNAWVFGDANVYGNAWVFGDANVYGNAKVYGKAEVCLNAKVGDFASVCGETVVFGTVRGNAEVSGTAQIMDDAYLFAPDHVLTIGAIGLKYSYTTFSRDKQGNILVKCGCFHGTLNKFLAKVEKTYGDSKRGQVYRKCAELAQLQIDTTPVGEEYE